MEVLERELVSLEGIYCSEWGRVLGYLPPRQGRKQADKGMSKVP